MSDFIKRLSEDLRIDESKLHVLKYRWDGHTTDLEILLRQIGVGVEVNWTAYVELKNSKYLSNSYLSNPSFREGDIVGVDTDRESRYGQPDMTLLTAIQNITHIIELWGDATDGGAK